MDPKNEGAPESTNETPTRTDSTPELTQARSADVRRELIALRRKHGAESPIGHRCSNVDEALQNLEHETDPDARAVMIAGIQKAMAEIAALLAAAP